jgi:transposase-like protein
MKKLDLGHVKVTHRFKNGVDQTMKIYNKKQKEMIINEVKNRPPDMNIGDVLKLNEISPNVYYCWVRKYEGKQGKILGLTRTEKEKIFWSLVHTYPEYERGRKQVREISKDSPIIDEARRSLMLKQIDESEREGYDLIKMFSIELGITIPEYPNVI